jgi:superfamily I DNA/RNA helicase
MLKQQNKRFLLFVYTNELYNFLQAAAHDLKLNPDSVVTLYSWVWRQYRDNIGTPPKDQYDQWAEALCEFFTRNPRMCPRYDVVLVDEAQDFSPAVSRLVRLLSKEIAVVGDGAQSLYESGGDQQHLAERWSAKQQHVLAKNYRNPRSVAAVAACFLTDPGVTKDAFLAMVPGRQSEMKPVWRSVCTSEEQSDYIADVIRSTRGQERIGILFANRYSLQEEAERLRARNITFHIAEKVRQVGDNVYNSATPVLITVHSAKGLEFDWVILPDLNRGTWDRHGTGVEKRRLFFVALTRTKNRVYLVAQVGQESAFLREIPSTLLQHIPSPQAQGRSSVSILVDDEDLPF